MAYKLINAPEYDQRLEERVEYLAETKANPQAASHLLDEVESVYDRLEDNPLQFHYSDDPFLARRGYRKVIVGDMQYVMLFIVDEKRKNVYIEGFFHQLEDYGNKM